MKRALAAIVLAIFAASASARTTPSTADFVKMAAISDMFEVEFKQACFGEKSRSRKSFCKTDDSRPHPDYGATPTFGS